EVEEIPRAPHRHLARCGRACIMLPNPIYGSWEKRLYDFRQPPSGEEKIEIKLDSLDTWQ
ncbi:MAG: hypothetical protein ABF297_08480, partial [Thiogranum sp.]